MTIVKSEGNCMINGIILKNAIISASNNISSQQKKINDLNIFPVPDGDTGTNMSMTVKAAATMLETETEENVAVVAKKIASAMLRGARGNSGVITSLLFRGFSLGLEGKDVASGKDIVQALGLGVDAAYKSVAKPTEGTILTVARMAYEKALEISEETDDAADVMQAIVDEASFALEQTPKMLPVLKRAGVVDAGGKGLLTIFEGMLSVIKNGEIIPETAEEFSVEESDIAEFKSIVSEFDEVINFTYCTEMIVGRNSEADILPSELKTYLESIGDCVVVVDDEEIIKVHVHTECPGKVLQKGLEFGQLLTVKVENMKEQHKATKKNNKEEVKNEKLEIAEPIDDFGMVTVAAGEGIKSLFTELGCAYVVSGGQSMNPSTDDIYEAIMATPAKVVFVFPNNKNIIMAAEQTVKMVEDRKVVIVPTRTIPQGVSALLAFDPSADAEENAENMMAAAKLVSTGQITYAARDSEFASKKIRQGDIIGLDNGKLTVTSSSPNKALVKLAKQMIKDDMTTVTIMYGENVSEDEVSEALEMLQDRFDDDIDFTVINGGQPVYYYIISIE